MLPCDMIEHTSAHNHSPESNDGSLPTLSVVIPVYDEEECISRCISETVDTLETHLIDYEIIFVDDGSTDRTISIILESAASNSRLKLVELSRNHGKPAAQTAGIQYARGQRILLMDPDLQESPVEIPRLMNALDEGFDIVYGIRETREDSFLTILGSRSFWWLLERMTGLSIPCNLSAMRIFNSEFRKRFLEYRENSRFIEGIMLQTGMRQTSIPIAHTSRKEGQSKFTFRRKVALATTAILDFSSVPLVLAIRFGLLMTTAGFGLALGLIVTRLFFMEFQLGWPSLIVTIITGFGLQILFTGIIGIYVGRIFMETKQRPSFSTRRVTGFDSSELPPPATPNISNVESETVDFPASGNTQVIPVSEQM